MGYKLAGCNVIGGVDIDPKMVNLYRKNHKPQVSFADGIIEFNNKDAEKFRGQVDILDGSPPCTPFSTAGDREKGWGIKKAYREGQALQVLDDLFFHFIETARLMQPKVVIAENVTGMIKGNAKGYTKAVVRGFAAIGYHARVFNLCASRFGVPQRRQRLFFIAFKGVAPQLKFTEQPGEVFFSEIDDGSVPGRPSYGNAPAGAAEWTALNAGKKASATEYFKKLDKKNKAWSIIVCGANQPLPTVTSAGTFVHPMATGTLTDNELRKGQSFPVDYDFCGNKVQYVTGMSVPPLMTKAVALAVIEGMRM